MVFRSMSRAVALPVALAMLLLSVPLGVAQAELVTTEQVLGGAMQDRAQVTAFLARQDVQAQLSALGVDPAEALVRVAGLSDTEVSRLAGQIDSLPAGEGTFSFVIGAAVFIFIVLLVTDLMGFTNVFPFTNKGSAAP